jgi:hypothetical protein
MMHSRGWGTLYSALRLCHKHITTHTHHRIILFFHTRIFQEIKCKEIHYSLEITIIYKPCKTANYKEYPLYMKMDGKYNLQALLLIIEHMALRFKKIMKAPQYLFILACLQ